MFYRLIVSFSLLGFSPFMMAYESAYEKTAVDVIEVKAIPKSRLIETSIEGEYFDESNGLFKRLFNYIKDNDVSMTIPVEASVDKAMMRFYLGSDAADDLSNTDTVIINELPERTVISVGERGSYSKENISESLEKVKNWIANQEAWEVNGEPYTVFWSSPFVPWFLKRYEIHIPVIKVD